MSIYLVNKSDLDDIADEIVSKSGGIAPLEVPDEFISEIGSISGGGGDFSTATVTFVNSTGVRAAAAPFCVTVGEDTYTAGMQLIRNGTAEYDVIVGSAGAMVSFIEAEIGEDFNVVCSGDATLFEGGVLVTGDGTITMSNS